MGTGEHEWHFGGEGGALIRVAEGTGRFGYRRNDHFYWGHLSATTNGQSGCDIAGSRGPHEARDRDCLCPLRHWAPGGGCGAGRSASAPGVAGGIFRDEMPASSVCGEGV